MNLAKVSNDKKLSLCRTYFFIGFALLPFVWAVNVCWFFKEAFYAPEYNEQRQMKKYVTYSAIGTCLWIFILSSWIITFQTKRVEWGAYADYMSFIIPLGKP